MRESVRPNRMPEMELELSDEEVLAEPPTNETDEDASYDWGTSRQDYYNADPIITEADAIEEEAEARRLQKKQLQGMTVEDFGLDDIDWDQAKKDWAANEEGEGLGKVISEVLPKVEITTSMSPEEKLKILRIRYPEFEPLAKEYIELQAVHQDLSLASEVVSEPEYQMIKSGGGTVAAVKLNALCGYLAALCMYFALVSATDTSLDGNFQLMEPSELHDHKIMDTLVRCRQLWDRVKVTDIPAPGALRTVTTSSLHVTRNSEHADQSYLQPKTSISTQSKRRSHRAKRAARAFTTTQAELEARRLERLRKTEESLKDLSSLTSLAHNPDYNASASTTAHIVDDINENDSDLGESTSLAPSEAARKVQSKKSLRFYTSQIAQKSNRRNAAGKGAGGDADIPYRERIRDRRVRLNAEAEARGTSNGDGRGAELDNRGDSSSEIDEREQKKLAKDIRGDEDNEYYDLVSLHAANKKALKAAQAEATREGGVVRVMESSERMDEEGKRGITYAIEKNKGLAPKRRKDVRNPRVKRRKKYEDKKKKLGSVRQVYKGGEGKGGYKGEMTGIKGDLVRSVKL
ncbi:MAG: hypothetical protein Q9207_004421 [Kuettlingeria erythrocarpa]